MQNFIQKINPQGGIKQLSGTGNPEGVVTGYVGQWYLDTAANATYRKDSGDNTNTGWALKAAGGSTSVIDNLASTSTTSALSANQGRILNEKNNLVYYNYFNGASTQVLYTSSSMDFRWDGTNKQFQYFPKYLVSGWHNASIILHKSTSIFVSTDDITSTQNQWFYFTNGGLLDATFNFAPYGNHALLSVTPEVFNASNPAYRLVAGCGNANSVWVNIYKNN